jgi:hypothetical protein
LFAGVLASDRRRFVHLDLVTNSDFADGCGIPTTACHKNQFFVLDDERAGVVLTLNVTLSFSLSTGLGCMQRNKLP